MQLFLPFVILFLRRELVAMAGQLRYGFVNKLLLLYIAFLLLIQPSSASLGDRLPDFKKCVSVFVVPSLLNDQDADCSAQTCIEENCGQDGAILRLSHRAEAVQED